MPNYAGFWRRFFAGLIDSIILAIPGLALGGAFNDIYFGMGLGFILGFIYTPFFESSTMQATPGKALLGMVLVHETTGERITFRSAVIRFFSRYLSMVILYIGYLMQPFTGKRQTLHDMIAETVVVRREPTDVNYFIVWKTQVKEVVAKL